MPGVYKEKECPTCQTKHRKKGPYCSVSCSNSNRKISDNIRNNMRKVATEYNQTPEAIAQKKFFLKISAEEFAVDIPDIRPDISEYDIFDGYDRGENW